MVQNTEELKKLLTPDRKVELSDILFYNAETTDGQLKQYQGIYLIWDTYNSRAYIGETNNIYQRLNTHLILMTKPFTHMTTEELQEQLKHNGLYTVAHMNSLYYYEFYILEFNDRPISIKDLKNLEASYLKDYMPYYNYDIDRLINKNSFTIKERQYYHKRVKPYLYPPVPNS